MDNKTTKDRILSYLEKVRHASVSDLSRALHVTRADIRYHLRDLIDDQIVTWLPPDKSTAIPGRGRPARQFFLSNQAKQDNLAPLTMALLTQLFNLNTRNDKIEEIIYQLAVNLSPPGKISSEKGALRLNEIIRWLNDNHYQARWEARSSGPCILFNNCPYIKILAQFPELCQLDQAILKLQTGEGVTIIETIDPHKNEIKACVFQFEHPTNQYGVTNF